MAPRAQLAFLRASADQASLAVSTTRSQTALKLAFVPAGTAPLVQWRVHLLRVWARRHVWPLSGRLDASAETNRLAAFFAALPRLLRVVCALGEPWCQDALRSEAPAAAAVLDAIQQADRCLNSAPRRPLPQAARLLSFAALPSSCWISNMTEEHFCWFQGGEAAHQMVDRGGQR